MNAVKPAITPTWPSRGSLLAYGYDRESTNYTRNALETFFQYLAKDPEVKEVSILAHSMGNWLALEALRQMAGEYKLGRKLFWDAEAENFKDDREANELLSREYRKGYELPKA